MLLQLYKVITDDMVKAHAAIMDPDRAAPRSWGVATGLNNTQAFGQLAANSASLGPGLPQAGMLGASYPNPGYGGCGAVSTSSATAAAGWNAANAASAVDPRQQHLLAQGWGGSLMQQGLSGNVGTQGVVGGHPGLNPLLMNQAQQMVGSMSGGNQPVSIDADSQFSGPSMFGTHAACPHAAMMQNANNAAACNLQPQVTAANPQFINSGPPYYDPTTPRTDGKPRMASRCTWKPCEFPNLPLPPGLFESAGLPTMQRILEQLANTPAGGQLRLVNNS